LVAFLFWHDCWERDSTQGIQSSLWTNSHFLSIGLVVFFIYASSHTTSQLIVLVFQRAQGLSVLQSSWRLLPIPIIGALSTHFVELLLPRVRANEVLTFAIVASSFAPLIMAVLNPNWPYWECAVFAVSLNSVASSSIIPIAAILIFESFSLETQRLAMGVICTIAMVGASVGMALAALISNDVTASENASLLETSDTWMSGYRVTFYFLLALNLVGLAITLGFLQKIGYLGRSLNT
jgi:MFS family permease